MLFLAILHFKKTPKNVQLGWVALVGPAHNFSHIIAQKQVHGKSLYSNCVDIRQLIFLLWTLETPIDHPDAKKWSKLNILRGFFEVQNC